MKRILFLFTFEVIPDYSMRTRLIILLLLLLSVHSDLHSQSQDSMTYFPDPYEEKSKFPKIGLSLSGGGARGLAHIAVLRALDSVGLRVDYVTGTSVGAIMGSLYSSGYRGDVIDSIASQLNWDELLSDRVPLQALGMEEKDMNSSYALELPYRDNKFTISRSLLEGQGIWTKFTEYLFPVMGINDFSKLEKGFKCVAANIADGHEVLLEEGSIVDAVRASMAVPAAFSPVQIGDEWLIDGGVTRNLPVEELIDMGAEYIIGIDLNHGGDTQLDFDNPLEVLLNIGFYSSNKDFEEQSKLCDYHFSFDLRKYGAGDFSKTAQITQVGYDAMDSLVSQFGRIKTMLENTHGPQPKAPIWEGARYSYKLDSLSIRGMTPHLIENISHLVRLDLGSHYTQLELKHIIDEVFSTNRFKSLHYNIYNIAEDSYTLELVAVPKEDITLLTGIQYNEFERINLIAKLHLHDELLPNSLTNIGGAIGQNARLDLSHIQAINKNSRLGIKPFLYLENITLKNRTSNFEINSQYRQKYRNMGVELLSLRNPVSQIIAAWRYENVGIDPNIYTDFILNGRAGMQSLELQYNINTINRKRIPTAGTHFHSRLGYIYKQNSKLKLSDANNNPVNMDSLGFGIKPYFRLHIDWQQYFKLAPQWILATKLKSYNNISFTQNLIDNYQVGGIQKTFRNQISMVGLEAADLTTSSYTGIDLDLQYYIWRNTLFHARTSIGTYDYLSTSNHIELENILSGYGLELQYNSLIGPIHLATTYSDYSKKLGYTIYLGILF